MKRTRYTKFTGDLASSFGLEDLMQALSDFLLDSGFDDPMSRFQSLDGEQTMDNLREAIRQALESGELFDEEAQEKFESLDEDQVEELIDQIIQKMQEQNFINAEQPQEGQGEQGDGNGNARFEVTDKGMDFLGYKALRELLGPLGKSSLGRHDTRHEAAGVETNGSSKPYEFGDSLNLDITTTLSNVFAREGTDFNKHGGTPQPRVLRPAGPAGRLPVLLRHRRPARLLPLHDPLRRRPLHPRQARRHGPRPPHPHPVPRRHPRPRPLPRLRRAHPHRPAPRVKVGPHYTNTREGLRVAQRILQRSNKDMKQIVMITDGKPSALTLPDGRIYKNAFGLDPLVISETLEEVARCKRSNIMINTFMLASDFHSCSSSSRSANVPRQSLLHHPRNPRQLPPHGLHEPPHENRPLAKEESKTRVTGLQLLHKVLPLVPCLLSILYAR